MILAFAKIYKSRLPINDRTQLRLPSMEDGKEQGRWRWIAFRFEPAHYAGVPVRRDIFPPRRGTSQRERCRSHLKAWSWHRFCLCRYVLVGWQDRLALVR